MASWTPRPSSMEGDPSGPVLQAVALVVLVLMAPMGNASGYAVTDGASVRVADGTHPQTDIEPIGPIERLHAEGITGDNVTVGVLDVSGFDTRTPALAGQVAAERSFGPGARVPNLGQTAHGTATASIIASVAPDAELYLASFQTEAGYVEAFDWLLENEVDVVVVPVSFYGQPRTADATITEPARRATKRGTTVIAAAGNLANSHWRGEFTPDPRGRLQFDGESRNYLEGDSSRATIWVTWESESDAEFQVELYREGDREPVAVSSNYTHDTARNHRLSTTIDPSEDHYFIVRGPPFSDGHRLAIDSPTHEFTHAYRHGSVSQPAVPEAVISVGAYDVGTATTAPYSGAGPVAGNPGVDVVAPTKLVAPGFPRGFQGSSASAAYAGGLAALVYDVDRRATPAHVESLLERTARDVGRPGPDTISGYGVVEAEPLVRLAENESTPGDSTIA